MIHGRPRAFFLNLESFNVGEFQGEFFNSCLAARPLSRSPTTTAVGKVISEDSPLTSDSYPGAFYDFYGFPSNPVAVYRTGDEWPLPTGPEAYRVPKEARPICNHPVQAVWHTLGEQIYKFLDSLGVLWSTIDPVRFRVAKSEEKAGPLYLWVGVHPGSLSLKDAKVAAVGCKKILAAAQFPDIEIAFRESVFTWSAGPKLLDHIPFVLEEHPTADIRSPFTGALGVQIAPQSAPHFEGTGALYLCEGGQSDRVFLLTTRHVPLPPSVYGNEPYERKKIGRRHPDVLILGHKAYSDAVEDMMTKIRGGFYNVDLRKRQLAALGEAVEGKVSEKRQGYKNMLKKAEETITAVDAIHSDITKHWSAESERMLGHVVYAPSISVSTGPKQFTEDWALIELNRDKIDWSSFKGNVMYIGNKIPLEDLFCKLHHDDEGRSAFLDIYPLDSLVRVKGILKEEEICHPTSLDANGEECLIVIKNGRSSGVTIGRGTGIESFIRVYDDSGIKSTSMAIAIYPYSYEYGYDKCIFSAPGDSGSIVVDGLGRIVGMLTGGSGSTERTDVTYVTPYFWIEEQIKKAFPNSHLYRGVDPDIDTTTSETLGHHTCGCACKCAPSQLDLGGQAKPT